MTNKEAVIAAVGFTGYADASIDKVLIDAGLTGTDLYSAANAKPIDLAAITVLEGMLALSNISEGGYSIGFSTEGILARLGWLRRRWGITDGQPKIKRYAW